MHKSYSYVKEIWIPCDLVSLVIIITEKMLFAENKLIPENLITYQQQQVSFL
jgi:hypothetical protein